MRFHFPVTRRLSMPLLLLVKLLTILVLMSLSRWLFYVFNLSEFGHIGFFKLMHLMMLGLRFDLSAVFMLNLPLIFLSALPITFRWDNWYQLLTNILFVVANTLALAVNQIDIIYFRYISKRTTYEVFQFFGNADENILPLVGQLFIDFWYMLLILVLMVWVLIKITTFFVPGSPWPVRKFYWFLMQTIVFVLWMGVSLIFIRGGFQGRPISLVTAGMRTSPQYIPLVLNTPFSIVKTFGQKTLQEQHFFAPEEMEALYNPKKDNLKVNLPTDSLQFKDYNVVILVLESFGREHIGYYNSDKEVSITPFLDSLLSQSYTFEAWANGKRSIEALPAILASIPTLMPVDFSTSPYITNRIKGLGTLLGNRGYHTSFFHGGNNGTMNFDAFAYTAGFDHYYGRNEYGLDKDFDGQWGIIDGPFLQFTAQEMSTFSQPFVSSVMTLSSHHPYFIPESMEDAYGHAESKLEKSIAYTDDALQQFFNKIGQMPWFGNTIFVITADHTSESNENPLYRSTMGNYAIPIAFYLPDGQLKGKSNLIAQQTDIMPSVLALLHHNEAFVGFGENLFDKDANHFAINYYNNVYQLLMDDYVLHFSGDQPQALFNLKEDPFMEVNVLRRDEAVRQKMANFVKALIQQYNHRLIHNQLDAKE
jgi:phosphoglycerol transferase MdoB-like AlkP superfamily enzyme